MIIVRKDDKKAPTFEVSFKFNNQFNIRVYNINFTRVSVLHNKIVSSFFKRFPKNMYVFRNDSCIFIYLLIYETNTSHETNEAFTVHHQNHETTFTQDSTLKEITGAPDPLLTSTLHMCSCRVYKIVIARNDFCVH